MREAIHEILTDVSDSFSNMIDMALANEIRVTELKLKSNLFSIYLFIYFFISIWVTACAEFLNVKWRSVRVMDNI